MVQLDRSIHNAGRKPRNMRIKVPHVLLQYTSVDGLDGLIIWSIRGEGTEVMLQAVANRGRAILWIHTGDELHLTAMRTVL